MRNGAMSEVHFARFNAVREFDNHRIISELKGVDVSNMMSRREYVRFLNKTTNDLMYPLPKILEERLKMMNNNKEQGSEHINTNKRKRDKKKNKKKKKKKNEIDYDVSAADLFSDDGSDDEYTELYLNDPEFKAEVDEAARKFEIIFAQYEKEEEERLKMIKEKKEKKKNDKKKRKKKKKEEKYSGGGSSGDGDGSSSSRLSSMEEYIRSG